MTSHPASRSDLFFEVQGPEDPEALARLVLRCRQFNAWLHEVGRNFPHRDDMPFLYEQLRTVSEDLKTTLDDLGCATPSKGAPLEGAFGLQCMAWTIPVAEILDFLSHASKSGVLFVTTFHETFVLELIDGRLVHATSDNPPQEMRLGEILVAHNLLTEEELKKCVQAAASADELLGSYLVDEGLVERRDLHTAMAVQVQSLFNRLSQAENAVYRFRDGEVMGRPQGLTVNIKRLLLESARLHDERSAEQDLFGIVDEMLPILPVDVKPELAGDEAGGEAVEVASRGEDGNPDDELDGDPASGS